MHRYKLFLIIFLFLFGQLHCFDIDSVAFCISKIHNMFGFNSFNMKNIMNAIELEFAKLQKGTFLFQPLYETYENRTGKGT